MKEEITFAKFLKIMAIALVLLVVVIVLGNIVLDFVDAASMFLANPLGL